jgi:hypothetical protein
LPLWLDISRYDPEVVKMPVLVSIASSEGQVRIRYILNK